MGSSPERRAHQVSPCLRQGERGRTWGKHFQPPALAPVSRPPGSAPTPGGAGAPGAGAAGQVWSPQSRPLLQVAEPRWPPRPPPRLRLSPVEPGP